MLWINYETKRNWYRRYVPNLVIKGSIEAVSIYKNDFGGRNNEKNPFANLRKK